MITGYNEIQVVFLITVIAICLSIMFRCIFLFDFFFHQLSSTAPLSLSQLSSAPKFFKISIAQSPNQLKNDWKNVQNFSKIATLISVNPVQKSVAIPFPVLSLQPCASASKYLSYLVLADPFITFIPVFSGIWQHDVEFGKQTFLRLAVIVSL